MYGTKVMLMIWALRLFFGLLKFIAVTIWIICVWFGATVVLPLASAALRAVERAAFRSAASGDDEDEEALWQRVRARVRGEGS